MKVTLSVSNRSNNQQSEQSQDKIFDKKIKLFKITQNPLIVNLQFYWRRPTGKNLNLMTKL